jgi:hypothetical protein
MWRQVRTPLYGCDCYAYALLASGFCDLVVEADMKPYDYMALVPIVRGAGGVITDWKVFGSDLTLSHFSSSTRMFRLMCICIVFKRAELAAEQRSQALSPQKAVNLVSSTPYHPNRLWCFRAKSRGLAVLRTTKYPSFVHIVSAYVSGMGLVL